MKLRQRVRQGFWLGKVYERSLKVTKRGPLCFDFDLKLTLVANHPVSSGLLCVVLGTVVGRFVVCCVRNS